MSDRRNLGVDLLPRPAVKSIQGSRPIFRKRSTFLVEQSHLFARFWRVTNASFMMSPNSILCFRDVSLKVIAIVCMLYTVRRSWKDYDETCFISFFQRDNGGGMCLQLIRIVEIYICIYLDFVKLCGLGCLLFSLFLHSLFLFSIYLRLRLEHSIRNNIANLWVQN